MYYPIRSFADFVIHVFFGDIIVTGLRNVPSNGPIIITGNHKNQFVDPMIVSSLITRPVSFLIAEKSMHLRIIGDFARMTGALPVIRPQDRARNIDGAITAWDPESHVLTGVATSFKESLKKGELVVLKGVKSIAPMAVVDVLDDAHVVVKPPVKPEDEPDGTGGQAAELVLGAPVGIKVIPRIEQSEVFSKVHQGLVRGQAVGIFPEGGSSDRTDLLPLKAGVSVMALGAADLGAPVVVIPFGLNYFNAHRWRSRVLVDVGEPIPVPPEMLAQFRRGDKREAYAAFLKLVEQGLRSVTFNAPDYHTMQVLRTMRRMYQGEHKLPPKRFLELNRRFAHAFSQFKADERFISLVEAIDAYMKNVERLGLSDRLVASMHRPGSLGATARSAVASCFLCCYIGVATILILPTLVMFGPMFMHINAVVKREVEKALKNSTVKVAGLDVAASQKVLTAVVWFPCMLLAWTVVTAVAFGAAWPSYAASVPVDSDLQRWWLDAVVWIAPLSVLFFTMPMCWFATLIGSRAVVYTRHLRKHLLIIEGFARDSSRARNIRSQRRELALKVQDFFEAFIIPMDDVWKVDPILTRDEILAQRRRQSDHKRAIVVASEIASMQLSEEDKQSVRASLKRLSTHQVLENLQSRRMAELDEGENEED